MNPDAHYQIGRKFVSASYRLEAEQIKAFAAEFDPQPFHTDEIAAAASPFGGLIASGWHTAAATMRLLVSSGAFAKDDGSGGTIGAGADLKWLRPTLAGDVLNVIAEITAIVPSITRTDRCTVTLRVETRNQRDETVQIMNAKIVVPRTETNL